MEEGIGPDPNALTSTAYFPGMVSSQLIHLPLAEEVGPDPNAHYEHAEFSKLAWPPANSSSIAILYLDIRRFYYSQLGQPRALDGNVPQVSQRFINSFCFLTACVISSSS